MSTLFPRRIGLPALLAATIAMAAAGCTTSAPSGEPSQAPAHTIVAMGDSIPYNSSDDCPDCTGFLEGYAVALSDQSGQEYTPINKSRHDGAKTADIVEELESGSLDAVLSVADIVILSIGLNDQPPYDESGAPCAVAALNTDQQAIDAVLATTPACVEEQTGVVRERLASILASIRALAPDAEIFALTAYNSWTGWSTLDATGPATSAAVTALIVEGLEQWRDAVCEEAAAVDGQCVDLFAAFNGADGLTPAAGLLAADYSHPSQEGNDRIRDLLLDASGA